MRKTYKKCISLLLIYIYVHYLYACMKNKLRKYTVKQEVY